MNHFNIAFFIEMMYYSNIKEFAIVNIPYEVVEVNMETNKQVESLNKMISQALEGNYKHKIDVTTIDEEYQDLYNNIKTLIEKQKNYEFEMQEIGRAHV